jgi:hypothetical protein
MLQMDWWGGHEIFTTDLFLRHFPAIAGVKQDLGLRRLLTGLNASPFDPLFGKNLSMRMHYCGLHTT